VQGSTVDLTETEVDQDIALSQESPYTKKDESDNSESSYGFKPSRSSHSVRNRFASLHNSRRETSKATIVKPSLSKGRYASSSSFSTSSSSSSSSSQSNSNVPEIKKFDRFKRPNYKNNFLKKYFPKPKISSYQDQDSEALEIFPSIVDNEDTLQYIDNEEEHIERLMTTLQVSSIYPKELSDEYLEVATIRSPYTFNIEDNEKSTRFITITKSITKSMDIAPTKSFTSSASSTLAVSEIKPSSSIPLFDTNSIPAPENILASTSTPYEAIIQGSSDIEFLSPVTLTSSLHHATPPLKTVTETLSTVETMIKKSILPVVFGEESSLYTLTQTYSVTRIVTAVKTVPPMELYEFNPQQNFADFDTLFEEAGSERRESLLPGELEFSDQDNFGLEGPSVIKVAPPSDFVKDLDLIGSKFDFVDQMEKHNNPDVVQLKGSTPNIDSSFGQNSPSFAPEVTPEQLLYLQFLSNPLAALGIGGLGAKVITESSPIYKTEPVLDTTVLKLFFGAKETYTTLVNTAGVTTKTSYVITTKTISQAPPAPAPGAALPNLGLLGPSFTVVTSPVTRDTVVTKTNTEEFKITFRNQETFTTITSTSLVSTRVTSYITKTQTINPLAGLLG